MRFSKQGWITAATCMTILLLMYAAVSKGIDFKKFEVQIGQSPMLAAHAKVLAFAVPLVEVMISVVLLFSRVRLYGLYLSFTLMMLFTVYIAVIMNFSSHVPCSCGGVLEGMGWKEHFVFNVVMDAIIVSAIVFYDDKTIEKKS